MSYGTTDPDASRQAEDKARKGPGPKICRERMHGKPCKECTQVAKLYQSEEETDNNLASRCRSRPTFYFVIVDLKDKGAGRQLYGCGIDNFKTLNDLLPNPKDPDDANIDYTSVKKPYPVLIKRKGAGLKTKYTVSVSRNATTIPPKLLKLKPVDLDRILEILESEELPVWTPAVDATNKIYIFPPAKGKKKNFGEVWYHWNYQLLGIGVEEDEEFEEGDEEFEDDDDSGDDDDDFEDDDDSGDDEEDDSGDDEDDDEKVDVPKFAKMSDKKLRKLVKDEELGISSKKLKSLSGKKLRKAVEKAWREEYDVPI